MKRVKKWLVCILAVLSLSCIGMACVSCDSEESTEGLVYYPLDDGTYAVGQGRIFK